MPTENWTTRSPSFRQLSNPSTRGYESVSFPLPASTHPDAPVQGGLTEDGRHRVGLPKPPRVGTAQHANAASDAFMQYPSYGANPSGYWNSLRLHTNPGVQFPQRWPKMSPTNTRNKMPPASAMGISTPYSQELSGYTRQQAPGTFFTGSADAPSRASRPSLSPNSPVIRKQPTFAFDTNNKGAMMQRYAPPPIKDQFVSTMMGEIMTTSQHSSPAVNLGPPITDSGYTRAPIAAGVLATPFSLLAETQTSSLHPKQVALRSLVEPPGSLERHAHKLHG